ncbi:MAG TPA: universal stress protein [Chthoniobacterales bacterium]|nr:universal stress protein [Chthoniobacterales bacterium]
MDEPQYRRIAVASTFSPRFEQVLAEAKRVRDRFGSQLHLIYVGEKSAETNQRFATALAELELPGDSTIFYQEGSPAEAILEAAAAHQMELIVAGALEKEVVLRPFLGNVARRLVREARCSVMLFTKPAREPQPLRCIVFFVPDYSAHAARAFQDTLRLAAKEQSEQIYVIRIYTTFDAARASLRANSEVPSDQPAALTLEEEESALLDFIDAAGPTELAIETRCIRGNTGFAASDFVQSVASDLLVVPVEATPDSDGIPAQIAWVTDAIPCNLWIVR